LLRGKSKIRKKLLKMEAFWEKLISLREKKRTQ